MDAGGVFLGRNAFDFPRFNFCDAAVSFGFPRPDHGRLNAAVSRDQDAINQFRHHLNRHFTGFVNDLVQCNRHGASLTRRMNFDKSHAGTEEKTSETIIQKIFNELPVP